MKEIGESIGINIYQSGKMKKRAWKREVKTKIKRKYNKKLKQKILKQELFKRRNG